MKAVVLLALGLLVAQAAEPTGTLTLACEGTMTDTKKPDAKPEPLLLSGLIVDSWSLEGLECLTSTSSASPILTAAIARLGSVTLTL